MSSNTWFCQIRLLIVVLSLLVLVSSSSLTAGSSDSGHPCPGGDPNNRCAPSCSPFLPSCQ
ncbi:hypothetical protein PVAP13_4KG293900 [Panicum virgatum]|uniref:Uncharacterized protein n=1 Tax=Panicum virgatum TaxID=38727 RepID=A0A8T0TUJ5_PANVG|nr:hypothetical protein PVAP13_4KG293900 [Panicum virgatum]